MAALPETLVPLPERIQQLAATAPGAGALQCGGARLNRLELSQTMNRFASVLRRRSPKSRRTVGLLADHGRWGPACHLGALAAGACVVPISTMLPASSIARIVRDAAIDMLVVSATHRELVEEMLRTDAALAPVERIAIDFNAAGWESLTTLLATGDPDQAIMPRAADDPVEIIYSSGTTGAPKGIVMGHLARTHAYRTYAGMGMDDGAVALCATPPYSNPSIGLIFGALYAGGRAVLLPKFDALEFLKLAATERATHFFLVPTQLSRILAEPRFAEFDLSATRCKLIGGATLHVDLKRAALARWPGALIETYGMTEGGPAAVLRADEHPDKLDSVGRAPPGVALKIIGPDDAELPVGSVGEIVGRSPFMMLGYRNRPADSAALLWRDASGTAFLRSGDLGRLDAQGFLYVVGRRKEMIISGGFNIYPVDLESLLATHPAVMDSAVIGVPSADWGETPVAFVETRDGARIAATELREWANARLGRHQRIAELDIVAALPRNGMGKIDKRELLERHSEHARRGTS